MVLILFIRALVGKKKDWRNHKLRNIKSSHYEKWYGMNSHENDVHTHRHPGIS